MKVLFEWHWLLSRPAGDPVGTQNPFSKWNCCICAASTTPSAATVFGCSYLQKKSCRKRLVSSKAVLCRCESYPPAPGAVTRTDPHTRRWAACACRLSSKTRRSFEGPSDSRGLRCVTNVAPCCSAPRWGQRSRSADKCRGSAKWCRGNRLFLKIQMTEMWKKRSDSGNKCFLAWAIWFMKTSCTPR